MNDLQKLLAIRHVSAADIAAATGHNYHSVQKTIKGWRQSEHIKAAIAEHLGLDEALLFGSHPTALARQIAIEIDRRAECERARLRAQYLGQGGDSIAKKQGSGNG